MAQDLIMWQKKKGVNSMEQDKRERLNKAVEQFNEKPIDREKRGNVKNDDAENAAEFDDLKQEEKEKENK